MSPKYTLTIVSRILTHTGQERAIEQLAEIREAFLREVGVVAAANAEGSAKANKISFGDAKIKEVLKLLEPKNMDKEEKKAWRTFAATFHAAYNLAVATDGNVPLTEGEIQEREEATAAKKAKQKEAESVKS